MSKRSLAWVVAAAVVGVIVWPASPASAHPRGNFSVNQYAGLTLTPDRVEVDAVVDAAEIPTLQDRPRADLDGDGTLRENERSIYARAECARLADGFAVSAGGRLPWTVSGQVYDVLPGTGGLATSRLGCRLSAPVSLRSPATVRVDNSYRVDRVGWREITAVGAGVRLASSSVPAESVSGQLKTYPADVLSSAPDVRSATIEVGGLGETGAAAAAGSGAEAAGIRAQGGPSWLASAQSRVESLLGGRLTPVVVGLAFLLALLLGAGHAALPGHGKTVMAAYFAGRRGRIRDALAVGGTVTLAHTGGVLVLGVVLSTSTALAGEQVLSVLGVVSGVIVVVVGARMLVRTRRGRGLEGHSHEHHSHEHHSHDGHSHDGHSHDHGHSHGHSHESHSHDHHPHDHGHAGSQEPHSHDHHSHGHAHSPEPHSQERAHRHGHGHSHAPRRGFDLAGIGLAGGLVPSPSALVVLLGAIGLGRAGLGVALVLAYGVGMAATLTAVGLLLVVAQNRLAGLIAAGGWAGRAGARLSHLGRRVAAGTPTATAALIVLVGVGIGVRAIA
ncbi:hypothetical protein AB0M02_24630 [Actinoplanes sp. NPDC051861]|uniref:HoxN/HupN/NixA family nickel/cobalt transporter n=1 Tax=Actinoplanes sp. NPDC051861 TaxID=3155170 RepID=UPI00343441DD